MPVRATTRASVALKSSTDFTIAPRAEKARRTGLSTEAERANAKTSFGTGLDEDAELVPTMGCGRMTYKLFGVG